MTDDLVRDRRGPVLVARLNRPDARNALTLDMVRGIGAAIVDAEADPEIRAVVLTGTGARAFCAGMDLRADAKEGAMAFVEKRTPFYIGAAFPLDEVVAGLRHVADGRAIGKVVVDVAEAGA